MSTPNPDIEEPDLLPIFTVGHSTRTVPAFVELLGGEVKLVVDVRSVPRSLTNPQFNCDALGGELVRVQVKHVRIPGLGGLRKKSTVAEDVNAFWENWSFHNFADYAMSPEFATGLQRLSEMSARKRTAIMCAEAVW